MASPNAVLSGLLNSIEHLNGTLVSWTLIMHLGKKLLCPLMMKTLLRKLKVYEANKEKWERSNRLSLMIMKSTITLRIRGAIPDSECAKTYLASVEEQFKGSTKVYASTLIMKMLTTKYDGKSGVREHIMTMNDMAAKLKGMDMDIYEGFLVHFIMTSILWSMVPSRLIIILRRRSGP
uniref:UBN2_2 domain-containing protein n=1 Tax=Aegilops tauschii subsp. strangulata TaxID=200361 RepID=A0A453FG57_AEGTS